MLRPRAAAVYRLCLASLLLVGCDRANSSASKTASPKAAPAEVAKTAKEEELNTIRLTPKAVERLGIVVAPVELRKVARFRTYGGEYVLPVGASLVVSAPIGGTLQQSGSRKAPRVGELLVEKQPVFLLLPLLSPERAVLTPAERVRLAEAKNTVAQSRVDAAGQVEQSRVQVEAGKIAVERAERLLKDGVGTVRAVDDAKALLELANKTLTAAENRKRLVDEIVLDTAEPGTLEPLVIESPRNGMLRSVQAAVGATVATGAPLFEVMDYDPMWVKASVYAGEIGEIDATAAAQIAGLADRPEVPSRTAPPVVAPPTATSPASTVDLYYEVANPDGKLRPGERVTAKLPLTGEAESPTVPWGAVVHDIYGGAWVYEQLEPNVYVRRRVEVRYVADDRAVLARGPAVGTPIVTKAVVELFGTEFGFAK